MCEICTFISSQVKCFQSSPFTCFSSLPILSFLAPQTVKQTQKCVWIFKRKFSDYLWATCKHILLPSKVFTMNLASVSPGWHSWAFDLGKEKLEKHVKKPSIWLRYNGNQWIIEGEKWSITFHPSGDEPIIPKLFV
jgi:hypothetical protein